jgi:hypothetical protein
MARRQNRAGQVLAVEPAQTTSIVELVRLGKRRCRIEQDYRQCKGALGWTTSKGDPGPGGTST